MNAKTILTAAALAAAFIGGAAQAAQGARDPYLDGARTISEPRSTFTDGARSVNEPRSTFTDGARISNRDGYTEGARSFDPFTDGARLVAGNVNRPRNSFYDGARQPDVYTDGALVAGLDRVGVSSEPSRQVDPWKDGARQINSARNPFVDGARNGQRDVYTDGALV